MAPDSEYSSLPLLFVACCVKINKTVFNLFIFKKKRWLQPPPLFFSTARHNFQAPRFDNLGYKRGKIIMSSVSPMAAVSSPKETLPRKMSRALRCCLRGCLLTVHHSNSFASTCLPSPACSLPEWLSCSISVSKYLAGVGFVLLRGLQCKGLRGLPILCLCGGTRLAAVILVQKRRPPLRWARARWPQGRKTWVPVCFYWLQRIAAAAGCEKSSSAAIVECLREKTGEEMVQILQKMVGEIILLAFKWHAKCYPNRLCYFCVVILGELEGNVTSDPRDLSGFDNTAAMLYLTWKMCTGYSPFIPHGLWATCVLLSCSDRGRKRMYEMSQFLPENLKIN